MELVRKLVVNVLIILFNFSIGYDSTSMCKRLVCLLLHRFFFVLVVTNLVIRKGVPGSIPHPLVVILTEPTSQEKSD